MWKLIILLLAAYIAYKLFANDIEKKRVAQEKQEKEDQQRRMAAGEMAKDPECGVWVVMEDSISVKDGARTYYFCSYDCRDKFLKGIRDGSRSAPKNE